MAAKDNNKKKTKPNVNVWFLFVASSVIIIFFLWYFLIYVNGNEKLLIQKSFRVLNQVGENFKSREKSFRRLTESGEMEYQLNNEMLDFKEKNRRINRYFSGIEISKTKDPLDKNYFYFSKNYQTISTDSTEALYLKSEKIKAVNYKINKKDFFEPIERIDVFEEIIIVKKDSAGEKYEFIYSSFPGDLDVKNLDSLIGTDKGLSSGVVKDIELSGIEYVLFMTQIQLQNNELYYIGGVINKETYVRQIRSINAYVALLLLIIFFIFLFSIPLIKLKMISENLQLKMRDLSLSGLSIIFGAFFTLLVILSLYSQYQREDNVNESLEELSDSIRVTLIKEINQINNTLQMFMKVTDSLNKTMGEYESKVGDKQDNFYNVILNFDTTIQQKVITSSGIKNLPWNYRARKYFKKNGGFVEYSSQKDFNFSIADLPYKYYKLIFNLDATGQQKVQTTSRIKPVSSWDNYSFRKYFKESGEWELDSLQIMLDFIVSNTSGEKLGVVSEREMQSLYM